MKKIVTVLLLFLFISCDNMDDKMQLKNGKENDVYVRVFFYDHKNINETMVGLRVVKKNENKKIGILYSWESEFEKANQDSLYIAVFKDFDFLHDTYEQSSINKSDSLLRIGEYQYKSYSYKDLEKRDWKIVYPNDGFKKGYSIKSSNKN